MVTVIIHFKNKKLLITQRESIGIFRLTKTHPNPDNFHHPIQPSILYTSAPVTACKQTKPPRPSKAFDK